MDRSYGQWEHLAVPGAYHQTELTTYLGDTILKDKNLKRLRNLFSGYVELSGQTCQGLPIFTCGELKSATKSQKEVSKRTVDCLDLVFGDMVFPVRPLTSVLEIGTGFINHNGEIIPLELTVMKFDNEMVPYKWRLAKAREIYVFGEGKFQLRDTKFPAREDLIYDYPLED